MDMQNSPHAHEHGMYHEWSEEEIYGDHEMEAQEPEPDENYVNDCSEINDNENVDVNVEMEQLRAEREQAIQCMISETTQVMRAAGSSEAHASAAKALKELCQYKFEDDPSARLLMQNLGVDAPHYPSFPNNKQLHRSISCEEEFDPNERNMEMAEEDDLALSVSHHQVYHHEGSYHAISRQEGTQNRSYYQGPCEEVSPAEPTQEATNGGVVYKRIPITWLVSDSNDVGSTVPGHVTPGENQTPTTTDDRHSTGQGQNSSFAPNAGHITRFTKKDSCHDEDKHRS